MQVVYLFVFIGGDVLSGNSKALAKYRKYVNLLGGREVETPKGVGFVIAKDPELLDLLVQRAQIPVSEGGLQLSSFKVTVPDRELTDIQMVSSVSGQHSNSFFTTLLFNKFNDQSENTHDLSGIFLALSMGGST